MTTRYSTTEWDGKKIIFGETEVNEEKPINLLIGFHGAGSTPENMLILGNRLKLRNAFMVFPEGKVNAGEGIWSWWEDGPKQKESVESFVSYTSKIIDFSHQHYLNKNQNRQLKTCLWGFSQGGAASLAYTLLGTHALYKVASICGFLPELPNSSIKKKGSLSILGIFGANDEIVPSFLADHALEEMKTHGHQVKSKETSQSHEVKPENLQNLGDFFNS
jgi:predicted esterase